MPSLIIALVQLMPEKTPQENLIKGLVACEKAHMLGADLVLFPEMWQIGYMTEYMVPTYAIDHQSDFIQQFCKKAEELRIAIAITYLGKGESKPTNNIALIDSTGKIILDYAKVHVCSFKHGTESTLENGCAFKVANLDYAQGQVKIGAMICFDREFPESARSLCLQGAEIILTPNSCYMLHDPLLHDIRIQQFRVRAFENMVGVALANYPYPHDDGHSCAFDVNGNQIVMANEEDGIFLASFDLDKIRSCNASEIWGAKLRRPECYER